MGRLVIRVCSAALSAVRGCSMACILALTVSKNRADMGGFRVMGLNCS
jgi:hypothetical protein